MNKQQEKLAEIKSQIKELSFAKGKRDTEQINALRDKATKIENRINTYDKQLLRLESTTALKNVLEREKDKVKKKAELAGKEAVMLGIFTRRLRLSLFLYSGSVFGALRRIEKK